MWGNSLYLIRRSAAYGSDIAAAWKPVEVVQGLEEYTLMSFIACQVEYHQLSMVVSLIASHSSGLKGTHTLARGGQSHTMPSSVPCSQARASSLSANHAHTTSSSTRSAVHASRPSLTTSYTL